MSRIKLGAHCWNQYTDWQSLLDAGRRAERLGYDTLWTWDHLYPIFGASSGPILEGWLTTAAWAQATSRIRLGLLVGANTFRYPTLTAKLATTLDHISDGRAILGIGAGWFAEEHAAFGIPFGSGPPERLRWLGEALPLIRGMLRGEQPSAPGQRYSGRAVRNDPPPIQRSLPILIGGGGEQVTLRLVARYGDANNIGGGIEVVRRKEEVLLRHCENVGRDPKEVERTASLGIVVVRDSAAAAENAFARILLANGRADRDQGAKRRGPVGTPEYVAELLAPFVALGYRHLIAAFPSPYDAESMERLVTEVRPALGG